MTRLALLFPLALLPVASAQPPAVDKKVLAAEADRVAVIKKVTPAVVAVCVYGGQAMGSGVLIDPDGYAVTNYHVTEALGGPVCQCGLADGVLYDAVVVGLDPVGDAALLKLLPKEEGKKFPFAELGDSDTVKVGDWTFTMGNPHGFALDFTPSVAFGMVSATNRYLRISPASFIEYTDAIQVETAVNPGNSGGPLFDRSGKVVGINSAASVRRGGAANAGLGIAISVNQLKNFLGHLRAGLSCDHATLGALVGTDETGEVSKLTVRQILDESDAFRRGLRDGDQLLRFADRPLTSTNQYKNILGTFPKDWKVPVAYRRNNDRFEALVRLMGSLPAAKNPDANPTGGGGPPVPKKGPPPGMSSPAAKLYKEKKGYANYFFNEKERDRLAAAAKKHGDFTSVGGTWTAEGTYELAERKGDLRFEVTEGRGDDPSPLVKLKLNIEQQLEPLKKQELRDLQEPLGSGGLMMALYHYHRFLTVGGKGFEGEFSHAGAEPFYPRPADGGTPKSWAAARVDAEVIRTKHGAVECKWYFSKADATLLGFETFPARDEDPCEVSLFDYKPVDGKMLPHRIEVRRGDKRYAMLAVTKYTLNK
jgi:S1-C subfamily serine protease